MELPMHPMVQDFPAMDTLQYAALKADIAATGIQQPILLWRGEVVDGRHRLQAATEIGIPPNRIPVRRLPDDLPESDVWRIAVAANIVRRSLSQTQRAMVAAKMERRRPGAVNPATVDTFTRAQRAEMFGVSQSLIRRCDAMVDAAPPELAAKVAAGDMTLRDAEALLAAGNATPSRH